MKMRNELEQWLTAQWYQPKLSSLLKPLKPFEAVAKKVIAKKFNQRQKLSNQQPPVIVVGNLTVGGAGKTPIVMALANYFIEQGDIVAVVSRGYGATVKQFPHLVEADNAQVYVGDEPKLIAKTIGCPVVIDPNRLQAYEYAREVCNATVVISDDGLQHYALPRAIELVVVDAQRQFGNQHCLPAGPLREPMSRLDSVDYILCTRSLTLDSKTPFIPYVILPLEMEQLATGKKKPVHECRKQWLSQAYTPKIQAMCAIGNPKRFQKTLAEQGFATELVAFADHAEISDQVFSQSDADLIIITAKDAMKCASIKDDRIWVLHIEAQLPESFIETLTQQLAL